jgi:hypothetical protein
MDMVTGHVLLFVGVVGQTIILCCRVVCSGIYLMAFFMTFKLLFVLLLLWFVGP